MKAVFSFKHHSISQNTSVTKDLVYKGICLVAKYLRTAKLTLGHTLFLNYLRFGTLSTQFTASTSASGV